MNIEKKSRSFFVGKLSGYIGMLFIFSIVLYGMLSFFNKLPFSWDYLHILALSLGFIVLSKGITLWLNL
jgi:hypothetical protein